MRDVVSLVRDGVGSMSPAMGILLWLMLLDECTGIGKAIYLKTLTSDIGVHGLMRKGGCIILIVAVHISQPLIPGAPALDTWFAVAFVFFELLSVAENVARIGVPLPAQLVGVMRAFESVTPIAKVTKSTTEFKSSDPCVPDTTSKTITLETVVKDSKPKKDRP